MSEATSSSDELTFVKLVSAEGNEFFIDRNVAISASKTIRTMLEGQFREAQDNVIRFPEISNYILERVCQYLYYQARVSLAALHVMIWKEFASHTLLAQTLSTVFQFLWPNP